MKQYGLIIIGLLLALALLAPASAVNTKLSSLDYEPSPAQPGQYMTLFLKIENPGSETLRDQSYKLILEYPFTFRKGESEVKKISSIAGGDIALIEYDLLVDRNVLAGSYPVTLKFCADASCTSGYEQEIMITVRTGGTPKIEVGLEDADIFSAGKTGTITLHIINRGLLDVKFLVMELEDTEEYDIITPSRIYIGELESDDFETAEFTIHIEESVTNTKKLELPVLLEYSDENDKEYSHQTKAYVNIYSRGDLSRFNLSQENNALKYIAVLIGIGAIYLLYRYYHKKKKKK